MSRPTTRAAILQSLPPGQREPASLALNTLLATEDDINKVLGYHVLHFTWYELPVKWFDPPRDLVEVALGTAAVMRLVGRHHLADMIESNRTPRLHDLWREDPVRARRLLRESLHATGFDPPSTASLEWGDLPGRHELTLRLACSRMLEEAIDRGALSPGRKGWRPAQAGLVESWLATPQHEHGGRTPRQLIHAERSSYWIGCMTPDHYLALARHMPLPPEPPALNVCTATPLHSLLSAVGDGMELTAEGGLPPSLGSLADEDCSALRELAVRGRILRVSKGHLLPTSLARSMLADRTAFAEAAVSAWFGHDEAGACAAEVAAGILLHAPANSDELTAAVCSALADRMHTREGGPLSHRECARLLLRFVRRGSALGFIGTLSELNLLTRTGRAAALAGLVGRAHAPRATLD